MPSLIAPGSSSSGGQTANIPQVRAALGDGWIVSDAAGAAVAFPAGTLSAGDIVTLKNSGTPVTYQIDAPGDGSWASATKVQLGTVKASVQSLTTSAPLTLSATVDATVLADANASGSNIAVGLPLIANIPSGETRMFVLKKSDATSRTVGFTCAGSDEIEQIGSIPIAFAASLSWDFPGAITVVSDATNNRWLVV